MATIGLSHPSLPPPTSALPQLPVSKIRAPSSSQTTQNPTSSSTSKLTLRTPSKIVKPATVATSHTTSPSIPTLQSQSIDAKQDRADDGAGDTQVRRSVSIANFPQPPKVRRLGFENVTPPGSPLLAQDPASNRGSSTATRASSLGVKRLKTKASTGSLNQMYAAGRPPSLLNGSGDGKSIPGAFGRRESSGLASVQSPPHSRSSSAQDSNSTSATTLEDMEEKRLREDTKENKSDQRRGRDSLTKDKEAKGNVIVSVRVRPDVGGDKSAGRDWLVDGRQSLIAYKGREGGDYYYGTCEIIEAQTNPVHSKCSASPGL